MAYIKQAGFTLMELMIVLIIVGILAAIAYPTYTSHIVETRRTDGQAALMHMYTLMERYYAENNTYASATINAGAATDISAGGPTPGSDPSPEGFYNVNIQAQATNSFTLQAVPTGSQAAEDTLCATLTINSLGQKSQTGTGSTADCWQ